MAMNGGWSYRAQVPVQAEGRTVLAHLLSSHRHSSADDWLDRLGRGEILVDSVAASADTSLRRGQWLVWNRPPWDEPAVPLHFDVLHEDEALLAVVKPSGLPTMPAGGFLEHTLLALVRARDPEASPLHRLGRFTSGIVLFARTRAAASRMAHAWRDREVEKRYRALVSGAVGPDSFDVTAAIGRVPHPRIGSVYAASADGKPSHSRVSVIERGAAGTLCHVDITTGRPHQIRIHLAYAGHPLVGDPLYAAGGVVRANAPGLPGDGGYHLHAERLGFAHPMTGEAMELVASPPAALLRTARQEIRRPGDN